MAVAGGVLIVHDGRHVRALDASEGESVWTHPLVAPGTPVRPVVVGSMAVVAADDGPVAHDVETGAPRWRLPLHGVRALHAVADEVYVEVEGPPARLHRVQCADGRIVAILPLPAVPHHVQISAHHVVLGIEESRRADGTIAPGPLLVRADDRLRGDRRWERLFEGSEVPVAPPLARGERLWLVHRDRLEVRALADGAVLARHVPEAAVTLLLPLPDGGAILGTGGAMPRAQRLAPDLSVRRTWTLPSAPLRGQAAGARAVLVDADGLQILEMEEGPRWGVTGLPPIRSVELGAGGQLVAQVNQSLGDAPTYPERLIALGLR
jgi:hypothetical protein